MKKLNSQSENPIYRQLTQQSTQFCWFWRLAKEPYYLILELSLVISSFIFLK